MNVERKLGGKRWEHNVQSNKQNIHEIFTIVSYKENKRYAIKRRDKGEDK